MRDDINALLSRGRSKATADPSTLVGRAQNVATVIAVVVIGIVALVGILIFGEVYDAMPEMEDGHPLEGEVDGIVGGFGDAMGLVPIILIVLLASVVIGVVQRMRGM